MKVSQFFNLRRFDGDLGVEVEVEGGNLPQLNGDNWRTEHDGSLNGGTEYVMNRPKSIQDTYRDLDFLSEKLADADVVETVRAGVHVHINVQSMEINKVFALITAFGMLEGALLRFCGDTRVGNLFCLRMIDAQYLPYSLYNIAKSGDYIALKDEVFRYCAVNVCSIPKYGSLEFRSMRSTQDFNVIKDWCAILMTLRDVVAQRFNNPKDVLDFFHENGSRTFCKTFLGDFFHTLVGEDDLEEEMAVSSTLLYRLAYGVNWLPTKLIGGVEFPINVEFPNEPEEDV